MRVLGDLEGEKGESECEVCVLSDFDGKYFGS